MPEYRSLLLVDAGVKLDNDPVLKWIAHLGYSIPKKELGSRVKLHMWLDGKRPYFGVNTEKEAEEFVKTLVASDGRLEGFSLMTDEELATFEYGRIAYKGTAWQFKRTKDFNQPYFRRLLIVGAPDVIAVAPNVNDEITGTITIGDIPESARPIYFDPIRIELSEGDRYTSYLVERKFLGLEDSACCLLPPVRCEFVEKSYFESDSVHCRQAVIKTLVTFTGSKSIAYDKLVIQDDPFVRDLLIEGATVDVTLAQARDTQIELTIHNSEQAVAQYRQEFLKGGTQDLGPMAKEVSAALQADLVGLLDIISYSSKQSKRNDIKPEPRPTSAVGSIDGSWNWLYQFQKQIESSSAKEKFNSLILNPNEQPEDKTFNNAGAEDSFLANCWRYGGAEDKVPQSWRAAFLALLNSWKGGEGFEVDDYLLQTEGAWPRLLNGDDGIVEFIYQAGATSSEDLEKWKYILPGGSRFIPGGVVVLDDGFNRLDDGFVLT